MSFWQSVCFTLGFFQYNEIIGVNIVFASFAGLLNFDLVVTAYRWIFSSGKPFFNLFSTHPLNMSNPFRSVLKSPAHICHWSLIVFLIIFDNDSVHANRMQIASYSNLVFVCFVNSTNSWMGKRPSKLHLNAECPSHFVHMQIFCLYCIQWDQNVQLKFNLKLLFSILLCAIPECATSYWIPNAFERINDKHCFWFTVLENSTSTPRVHIHFAFCSWISFPIAFAWVSFLFSTSQFVQGRFASAG